MSQRAQRCLVRPVLYNHHLVGLVVHGTDVQDRDAGPRLANLCGRTWTDTD